MKMSPLLTVSDLSVSFKGEKDWKQVLNQVSFDVFPDEVLGIVGESGSGKSVASLAVLGLLPPGIARIENGTITFKGIDLAGVSPKDFQNIRGKQISMVFQEPMSSLNPSMRCGAQVTEVLLRHEGIDKREAKNRCLELFEKVRLPTPEDLYHSYPHQLSGGQKQRVMIAMAMACKPELLIADEATTALDVTVQNEILKLLKSLQEETGMSIIFISHDLALVSEIAQRVVVMYRGQVVEQGLVEQVFLSPSKPYTQALIGSRPPLGYRIKTLPTVADYQKGILNLEKEKPQDRKRRHEELYAQEPLLEVRDVSKEYFSKIGFFGKGRLVKAVDGVSFKLFPGETLGLVGESGCGKSTLGMAILQLERATSGSIRYRGKELTRLKINELRKLRQEIQLIFQDPYASLNPRLTLGQAILEPMKVHGLYNSDGERQERVMELLNLVGLDQEHYYRYPHEFSGGQRQRVGIARSIALNPKLLICDESVSALDISVQAQVLNLLNELKDRFSFSYIFISHDLSVVKYMADRLMVMNKGKIEELGEADETYNHPKKSYTKQLITAVPRGLRN